MKIAAFLASLLVILVVANSCNTDKRDKTYLNYYFIKNATNTEIKIVPTYKDIEMEKYCTGCFLLATDEDSLQQLATTSTIQASLSPSQVFSMIKIYRNDSLKLTLNDSIMSSSGWNKVQSSQLTTDYFFTITNL